MISFKKLVEAGVHFGHKRSRWNPKMAPFIWGFKNDIHLIDVSKTAHYLEKAAQFLKNIAAEGKSILWVGTKKVAQNPIKTVGARLDMPSVTHRWIGGTLTNFPQVKKSITKLLHFEDILKKSEHMHYTKKELVMLQKSVDRLKKNVGSIINLSMPVGALVVVDVRKEQTAIKEARVMGVPVIAIADTNADPSLIDFVIPSNDDAPKAIITILDYLAEFVELGKQEAAKKVEEIKAKKEKEKVEASSDKEAVAENNKTEVKKASAKTSTKVAKAPRRTGDTSLDVEEQPIK